MTIFILHDNDVPIQKNAKLKVHALEDYCKWFSIFYMQNKVANPKFYSHV